MVFVCIIKLRQPFTFSFQPAWNGCLLWPKKNVNNHSLYSIYNYLLMNALMMSAIQELTKRCPCPVYWAIHHHSSRIRTTNEVSLLSCTSFNTYTDWRRRIDDHCRYGSFLGRHWIQICGCPFPFEKIQMFLLAYGSYFNGFNTKRQQRRFLPA